MACLDKLVVEELKVALTALKRNGEYLKMIARRDSVLGRYQPILSIENLPKLTEAEFRSFLVFENNGHWNGLHRQGPKICSNMEQLRSSLRILLDDTKPIATRLDEAVRQVPGMGKAIATAVLLIANPQKYGVWNRTSEFALEKLGLLPDRERGETLGHYYEKINAVLVEAAEQLEVDLWTLDGLWWFFLQPAAENVVAVPSESLETTTPTDLDGAQRFALEKHLHHFLEENWDSLDLSKEWEIYSRPGEPDLGIEFKISVGRIDILAKHKTEKRWLVIELKRGKTSDETVGQILRYIGFIKNSFAPDDSVEGLIISHSADASIQYALSSVNNVKLRTYEVSFSLRDVKSLASV